MAKQYNRVVQVIKKSYSLGQGIEDGFLATYKMHRIRTNIDKEGLHIQEALEKGAELFVPEEAAVPTSLTTNHCAHALIGHRAFGSVKNLG